MVAIYKRPELQKRPWYVIFAEGETRSGKHKWVGGFKTRQAAKEYLSLFWRTCPRCHGTGLIADESVAEGFREARRRSGNFRTP